MELDRKRDKDEDGETFKKRPDFTNIFKNIPNLSHLNFDAGLNFINVKLLIQFVLVYTQSLKMS